MVRFRGAREWISPRLARNVQRLALLLDHLKRPPTPPVDVALHPVAHGNFFRSRRSRPDCGHILEPAVAGTRSDGSFSELGGPSTPAPALSDVVVAKPRSPSCGKYRSGVLSRHLPRR